MSISARAVARLLSTAACIGIAAPAAAQDAQPGTFLGRLILGAGQAKVAIDTPQAVTAVEQEDIDREQASNVGQMFRNVPGVQTAGSDRPLGFAFNIRGIGATEQTASESRIIVNVDGVPKFYEQYRLGSFFTEPELYKRVEVLRGPASATLYGSGAIGGAVNFETKDAGDFLVDGKKNALRLKFGLESNGNGRVFSGIYATAPTEGAEFLAALGYRESDEFRNGNGVAVAGSESSAPSALLKGTFRLGDNQTLRLSWQRFESDSNNAALAQTGGNTLSVFGRVKRDVSDDTISASWQATTDNPWLNPKVQLSYSDTAVSQWDAVDLAGNPQACSPVPSNLNVWCDVDYAYRTVSLKAENTANLSGNGWDAFLTFGVQASTQDRVAASEGPLNFHPEGTDRKIGVYAQADISIGDRLTIIPGARIDFARRTPGADIPGGIAVSDHASAVTLAALYRLTDDVSVFGSVARTERLPTLDELYSWSTTKAPAVGLEKETATNVELGLAWSRQDVFGPGDSLQLKATLFRNDIRNLITTTPNSAATFFGNTERGEFWGGEVEAGYEAERFFARLAYSNVRGRARGTSLINGTDYAYVPSTVPAENVALTLGYRIPDKGLEFGWRGTFVDRITTASRSTTTGNITSASYAPYDLHDFYVSWKPQAGALAGFDVQFAVENAFDQAYQNNLSLDPGRGRTFKVSLARALTW
ncbi:MAG: TonB-dependent receptor [Paracoccaceae bacterium]|nr:MAG: TonB-dependent receptor [Paracoccaceae bacterium]